LRDLDQTAHADVLLILAIFNEKNSNPDNFTHADDTKHPSFGVIYGEWAFRAAPLEPKAKAILSEIRNQLGTK
jgi:hypothetical protein